MGQQLKVLTTLPEDPGSLPTWQLTTSVLHFQGTGHLLQTSKGIASRGAFTYMQTKYPHT